MACFQWHPHTPLGLGQWRGLSIIDGCHYPIKNQVATMKIGQWEVIWCIQLFGLCWLGGVKDGRDTKSVRDSTEVTLLKHASASNKHVCEVRSIAHRSQHMFIAPEKKCLYAYL